jgi:pyrroloquinoline-quinone synthase
MNPKVFQAELDAQVARYDLLAHPFYQSWSAGKLSHEHLRAYALEFFHLVAAFPTFLSALHSRLHDGQLRRAVLRNLAEEEVEGRAYTDMWMDFAEGLGLSANQVRRSQPSAPLRQLIEQFYRSASQDSPAQVLAAIYAYASQVPQICGENARALLQHYGADDRTCGYFVLHTYAGVRHATVWRSELLRLLERNEPMQAPALESAGRAAEWLWKALDGCQAYRLSERSMTA